VHERLDLDPGTGAGGDRLERELTRKRHALDAHARKRAHRVRIHRPDLG